MSHLYCMNVKMTVFFQMPEEQAFCVLVKIMYQYGLRTLYKNNFEDLHCKFYQLEKLMQVNVGILIFIVIRSHMVLIAISTRH